MSRNATFCRALAGLLSTGLLAACAAPRAGGGLTPEATPAAAAPSAPSRGTFTITHGADTIGVERFTRTAERLDAEFWRSGRKAYSYTAALTPDAAVSRVELTMAPSPSAAPGTAGASVTAVFFGDSVDVSTGSGDILQNAPRHAAPRGTVPYVNPSASLMEQIVRRARVLAGPRGASSTVAVMSPGSGSGIAMATVAFVAPDSARIVIDGVALALRVDASGAILGGRVPAQGLSITRTAP